jgi:hypothetical protein
LNAASGHPQVKIFLRAHHVRRQNVICTTADYPSPKIVRRSGRGFWSEFDKHRLCAGLDDDKPLSVDVSIGVVSQHQIRGQDACPAGFARQYSEFYTCFRRQTARCQRTRPDDLETYGNLCDGPGLSRFRAILRSSRGRRVVCYPRHIEHRSSTSLFGTERPDIWGYLRSGSGAVGILQPQELSLSYAPYSLQGHADGKDTHLSDQSVWSSGNDHLRAAQNPLSTRVIFKIDQAISSYQYVLRHLREHREGVNLGGRVGYVLVAIVRMHINLDASLHTLFQIFSVTLSEKIRLNKSLFDARYTSEDGMPCNQLNLVNN